MPPDAPAPRTPTSSSPKPHTNVETRTFVFVNKYDEARCKVCKGKVPKDCAMEGERRKNKSPGVGAVYANPRHFPSCPSPVRLEFNPNPNPAPAPVKREFGGNDRPGREDSRGVDPAINPPSPAPLSTRSSSPEFPPEDKLLIYHDGGSDGGADEDGKRKRDYYDVRRGDSVCRNLAETDRYTLEVVMTNHNLTPPPYTQPESPQKEKPLINRGGAAAANDGERKRDVFVRGDGSASRNLAATRKWTFDVVLRKPDLTPTADEPISPFGPQSTSDNNNADTPMPRAATRLSVPLPAPSAHAATLKPGSSSPAPTGDDYLGRAITVSDVFKMRGRSYDNDMAKAVGQEAKKMYSKECGRDAKKLKRRKTIGLAFEENVYPSPHGKFVFQAFDVVEKRLKKVAGEKEHGEIPGERFT